MLELLRQKEVRTYFTRLSLFDLILLMRGAPFKLIRSEIGLLFVVIDLAGVLSKSAKKEKEALPLYFRSGWLCVGTELLLLEHLSSKSLLYRVLDVATFLNSLRS